MNETKQLDEVIEKISYEHPQFDAKAIDAQMGIEKAMSSLAVGLAGSNMIYESSGMTAKLALIAFLLKLHLMIEVGTHRAQISIQIHSLQASSFIHYPLL